MEFRKTGSLPTKAGQWKEGTTNSRQPLLAPRYHLVRSFRQPSPPGKLGSRTSPLWWATRWCASLRSIGWLPPTASCGNSVRLHRAMGRVLSCRKDSGTLAPRPPKLGGRGATTNCHSRQIREASNPASRSPHPILPRSVGYRSDRRHADQRRSGLLQLQKRCAGWQSSRWQLPDRHD